MRNKKTYAPRKSLLVVTTWSYKSGLVQSSTLPYLEKILTHFPSVQHVYLVTQETEKELNKKDRLIKVGEHKISLIPQRYYAFGLCKIITSVFQFFQLWWLIVSKNITHIHCFCTPAGGIGYLLSVLTGRKLILDSYEPHAESMVENGTWKKEGLAFNILWWLEKKQTQRASYCLTVASGMEDYALAKYGVRLKNFSVRPMCVDLKQFVFDPAKRKIIRANLEWDSKIICVYVGKFGGIYLDKEAFDFFKSCQEFWGDQFRVLLLTPSLQSEIALLCKASNFPENNVHSLNVPFKQVSHYLSVADFAFTPVKPVPSKRYCSPIKDGEYWAIGLPVVITKNISDDADIIISQNAGAVLQSLDTNGYINAIKTIDNLLQEDKDELRRRIRHLAETYRNYSIAEYQYRNIYQTSSE